MSIKKVSQVSDCVYDSNSNLYNKGSLHMDNYMDNSILVKYKLDKEDYVKANKVILKMKQGKHKRIIFISAIAFAVVIGVLIGIINRTNIQNNTPIRDVTSSPLYIKLLPSFFILIAIIGIYIVLQYLLKNYLPKRHYNSNILVQCEMQIVIDANGIENKSERSIIKLLWDEVYKLFISKEFIVIFISNMTVFIIPKKYVSLDDMVKIENIIRDKVDTKKIKIAEY